MNFLIASLVISSLVLTFSMIALLVFVISGKKVFRVFDEININMQSFITNLSGSISQNNHDHDVFKKTLSQHGEILQKHRQQLDDHEDILRPRKQIKLRKNVDAEGRD